jgi:hypothetical protein
MSLAAERVESRVGGRGAAGLRLALQALLGGLMVATAAGKALDVAGFARVIDTYRILPPALLAPVAIAVIVGELLVGAWILSGRRLAAAALLSALIYAAWAALLGVTLLRGLDLPNCGCFGVFLARRLRWYSPIEDVAAVGLSLLLYRLAGTSPHGRQKT